MENQIEKLKRKYLETPVPAELDQVIARALGKRKTPAPAKRRLQWVAGAAASFVVLIGILNASPSVARAVSGVPLLGGLVEMLTFTEYKVDEGGYQADIKVPAITNTGDPSLEETLNQAYLEEGRALYDRFMAEMEAQRAFGADGHLRIDGGYAIKTDTDALLSVGRYVEITVGSSATMLKYDTIDKRKHILITLPSLFKDDRYIEIISEQIKTQMQEQMRLDDSKIYWIESPDVPTDDTFTSISSDQNFYINGDNQLVISFNEYEVAPGYMGPVEFVIPTDVLKDVLVSHAYIK